MTLETFWKRCSTCKREIGFGQTHWTCSVSTCNRKGNAFVFCSVSCWNAHVPTMRHRESWAEEQRSPSREAWAAHGEHADERPPAAPQRRVDDARSAAPAPRAPADSDDATPRSSEPLARDVPREVLIVASKLKSYVRARSGMNTSDAVMETLSDRVRALCDDAIRRARDEGRKTVLDRDF
jgi:hypothetical protein